MVNMVMTGDELWFVRQPRACFLGSLQAIAPDYLEQKLARQLLQAAREGVTIRRTELGSDLLMIGAAELVFESILSDPTSSPAALRC